MNRIKQLRNELNIGQSALAELLGIEVSAISKLELGKVPLREEYLIKLSNFFGVSTDYILGISNIRKGNERKTNKNDVILFEAIEGLEEQDKEIIRNLVNSLKNKK